MKRFASILFSLSLSAVVFAPAAKAQEVRPNNNQSPQLNNQTRPIQNIQTTRVLTPIQLATLANRGYLSEQGILGYGNLAVGLRTGSITAEDIIQAAIDAGRTAPSTGEDLSYRTALRRQLYAIPDRGSDSNDGGSDSGSDGGNDGDNGGDTGNSGGGNSDGSTSDGGGPGGSSSGGNADGSCFTSTRLSLGNDVTMTLGNRNNCSLLNCGRLLKFIGINSAKEGLL